MSIKFIIINSSKPDLVKVRKEIETINYYRDLIKSKKIETLGD